MRRRTITIDLCEGKISGQYLVIEGMGNRARIDVSADWILAFIGRLCAQELKRRRDISIDALKTIRKEAEG